MNNWIESEWNKVTSGANTDPTPQVSSKPGLAGTPHTWASPNVDHPGELHVSPDEVDAMSTVMKRHIQALEAAIEKVSRHLDSFGSLGGWQAAEALRTRLQNLVQQCQAAAQSHSDVQTKAALDLTRSADLYRSHEAATKKAMDGLGSAINAGTAPSAASHTPLMPNPEAR